MARHALYNPDRGVTEGGLCISAFVSVTRSDGSVYVFQPAPHPRWEDEWAPNLAMYEGERLAEMWRRLRLPAAYLEEGEHPRSTARRVLEDQLGLSDYAVVKEELHSYLSESRRFPGRPHWDLLWLTQARTESEPAPGPWASEGAWRQPSGLRPEEFGSGHGDVLDLLRPD